MRKPLQILAATTGVVMSLAAVPGFADDEWDFTLGIYGYFPDISGNTNFPLGNGDGFEIGIDSILDNLEFTVQGNFDVRKDRVGVFTDLIYLDVSAGRSRTFDGTIGGTPIPDDAQANIGLDVKSLIWTTSAYYRLVEKEGSSLDLMFGVRYADMQQDLSWELEGSLDGVALPGRTGARGVSASYLDGIVALRGHAALGDGGHWYIPYYVDVGTGDSDLTWQAATGVGYAFGWGEVQAGWRYLSYDMPSGQPIKDLELSGPQVGVKFRW